MKSTYSMPVIGVVRSPFREKFGLPRQAGLADYDCEIEMFAPYDQPEAFAGLEGFSHIWVSFIFHQAVRQAFQPTVRPPRLGGNRKVGVFASRSPFRPGNLGLSLVELKTIRSVSGRGVTLVVSGLDAVDTTPVVDIKPYLPYAESCPEAKAGFAPQAPEELLTVIVAESLSTEFEQLPAKLQRLIKRVIALDPRPAYRQREDDGEFGVKLENLNIRWRIDGRLAEIFAVDLTDEYPSEH